MALRLKADKCKLLILDQDEPKYDSNISFSFRYHFMRNRKRAGAFRRISPAGSARETAAAAPFSDTAKLRLSDSLAADRLNRHKTNLTILTAWAGGEHPSGRFLTGF